MTTAIATAQPAAQLMQLLTAKWAVPTVGALARLGVADLLRDGPRSAADLAEQTGAHPHALYRMLRAAASIGVFAEDGDGRFSLTPMADCLRSDVAGSLRAAAMTFTTDAFWRPYGQIDHSLFTGEPAFNEVFGTDVYGYLSEHPEHAKLFGEAAVGFYAASVGPIVAAYDFSRFTTVVDLGGGIGFLLASILRPHPHQRGVLVERPGVLEQARDVFTAEGIEARVHLHEGDFFESVPAGGDLYVIKSCLHNFRDERAISLLRVIRAAMDDDARLLVVDAVVPPGNEPHYSKFDDVEMLVIAGGIDRTEREWSALLEAGGFSLGHVVPASPMISILECAPV